MSYNLSQEKNTMQTLKVFVILIGFIILTGLSGASADTGMKNDPASGSLVQGYRILPIEPNVDDVNLVVYRGDYIKFDFNANVGDPILQIPDLSVQKKLTMNLDEAPYFKMKTMGRFRFSLGNVTGNIQVIEYKQPHYREVEAREAAELLQNLNPLLLDVRTPAEFNKGHLKNAILIPVQELQKRVGELSEYKHSDILIYCATGNRSTVASKILVDNGFKRIVNMRYGIYQWAKGGYPIVK
jgi:rhodanese-related sulfurtransferase